MPKWSISRRCDFDDVAHGDDGKIGAVAAAGFGIDAVRAGGAAAAAEAVRADHEVAIGVDALARPDRACPTSRDRPSSSCRATCESPESAWQISTALSRRAFELPVGLESHGHLRQPPAKLQFERLGER